MAASVTVHLQVRLPWWWRLLIEGAVLSFHLGRLVGLPLTSAHQDALCEFCARTIASRIRTAVVKG